MQYPRKLQFIDEMVLRGMPDIMAETIADRYEPFLNALQRGNTMQVELMGAVTLDAITTRINAKFPKITKMDYGLWNVASRVIKVHPDWTEDQVYTEVEKSFLPKSAGGLLVTKSESAVAIAKREMTQRVIIIGGLAVIGWFVYKAVKKRR